MNLKVMMFFLTELECTTFQINLAKRNSLNNLRWNTKASILLVSEISHITTKIESFRKLVLNISKENPWLHISLLMTHEIFEAQRESYLVTEVHFCAEWSSRCLQVCQEWTVEGHF